MSEIPEDAVEATHTACVDIVPDLTAFEATVERATVSPSVAAYEQGVRRFAEYLGRRLYARQRKEETNE